MLHLLLAMLGGAIGAGARHLVGKASLAMLGPNLPWAGTFTVNLVGGFAMGALVTGFARYGVTGQNWRIFLAVGVLGGFTTFSSFSLDAMTMIERGNWLPALSYALASVVGSIGALAIGMWLVRALP